MRASTTVEGCQAGRLGHLLQYMHKYNAESLKQGRAGVLSPTYFWEVTQACMFIKKMY